MTGDQVPLTGPNRKRAVQARREYARQGVCPGGKARYQKKAQALAALRRAEAQRYAGLSWLRVYQCPQCDGWHLTSKMEDAT